MQNILICLKQIQLLRNPELALRNCSPNQLGFLSEAPLYLEIEQSLGFLDHLMLGTPASPVRKILLESGLGDALVGGGVEDELLQPQFSIGL